VREQPVAAVSGRAADQHVRVVAFLVELGGIELDRAALQDGHAAVQEQLAAGDEQSPVDQQRPAPMDFGAGADRHGLPGADDAVGRDLGERIARRGEQEPQ